MPNMLAGIYTPVLGVLGLPHLPKWLTDPWGYIRDKFIDLYNSLGTLFGQYVIHPPGPVPGSWVNDMYGNALGLSMGLAGAVFLVLMTVSMFFQKKLISTGKALVIAVLIGTIGPLFYEGSYWLVRTGNDLTRAVAGGNSQQLLNLPEIHNVFGAIAGISTLLFFGGILLSIFLAYQLAIILATFFALPLLTLYPLGRIPQGALRWVVSVGTVAALLGRPTAALELNAASHAIDGLPKDTPSFVAIAILIVTFLIAILTQIGLVYLAHKGYSGIEGIVRGSSLVHGKVEMTTKDTLKVESDRANDRYAGRMAAVAAVAGPEVALAAMASDRLRRPSANSTSTHPSSNGGDKPGEG
jgi:hypothetical protein